MAGRVGERVALAGVEEQLSCLAAQAPQRAWALNPGAGMGAFKTAGRAQGDGGIKGADGDADLRVGGGGLAFGSSDIGAALEQLRRHAEGNLGKRQDRAATAEC